MKADGIMVAISRGIVVCGMLKQTVYTCMLLVERAQSGRQGKQDPQIGFIDGEIKKRGASVHGEVCFGSLSLQ